MASDFAHKIQKDLSEPSDVPYAGKTQCDDYGYTTGKRCRLPAHWTSDGKVYCYHHKTVYCTALPKHPNPMKHKCDGVQRRRDAVKAAREENVKNGVRGKVACSTLFQMKPAKYIPGYTCVFVESHFSNHDDGIVAKELCPKQMGPVHHGQPRLPVAKNLANLYMFSKVMRGDMDPRGYPSDEFYKLQKEMYACNETMGNVKYAERMKLLPLFCRWILPNNTNQLLDVIEGRQIFCHFYEYLARTTSDYRRIVRLLDDGYNVQIVGHTGYALTKSIAEHYADPAVEFGHELVLYTMLTVEDEGSYPWRRNCKLSLPISIVILEEEEDVDDAVPASIVNRKRKRQTTVKLPRKDKARSAPQASSARSTSASPKSDAIDSVRKAIDSDPDRILPFIAKKYIREEQHESGSSYVRYCKRLKKIVLETEDYIDV